MAEDVRAEVLAVVPRPFPYYTLTLAAPKAWRETRAGQFVMLQAPDPLEPYLRRAFSVHDLGESADASRVEILAKIVGPGTAALAALAPGDHVRMLGPLGRPFGWREAARGRIALVAGGVGSAPLWLLGQELLAAGRTFDFFYGGRSAIDLARREEFARLAHDSGGRAVETTEDGSRGERGRITAPLERGLAEGRYTRLYACGPMGLLAALARLAREHGVAGEAALETPMGCGFGACLGCAVPHVSGRFVLCCKDGPVFRFDEVRW